MALILDRMKKAIGYLSKLLCFCFAFGDMDDVSLLSLISSKDDTVFSLDVVCISGSHTQFD